MLLGGLDCGTLPKGGLLLHLVAGFGLYVVGKLEQLGVCVPQLVVNRVHLLVNVEKEVDETLPSFLRLCLHLFLVFLFETFSGLHVP